MRLIDLSDWPISRDEQAAFEGSDGLFCFVLFCFVFFLSWHVSWGAATVLDFDVEPDMNAVVLLFK